MNTVLNALKCVNCRKTLSQPIILPCGHSICKSHADADQQHVMCSQCGVEHSNKGFTDIKALSDLILVQLNNLDFGPCHNESVKSCEELKKQLQKNDLLLDDSEFFIHDKINELKNKVLLKSEQVKLRVDEITQELIDELNEFEQSCKARLKQNIQPNEEFESVKNEFRRLNEENKLKLESWSNLLNELKVDETKWKEIKVECAKTLENMDLKIKQFEKELLMNKFADKSAHVGIFTNADIDSLFQKKVLINI